MGRTVTTITLLILALAALTGCTLTQDRTPRIMRDAVALLPVPTSAPTEERTPTPTDPPTERRCAERRADRDARPGRAGATAPVETLAPAPRRLRSVCRRPSHRRARRQPPTVPPLDDGSGRAIAGTRRDVFALTGFDRRTRCRRLYYLGGDAGAPQVWRLQWGLTAPEQLSFNPWGVAAYSVAPDGTLAYIATNGEMTIGGLPIAPPSAPDGTRLLPEALAWSPLGGWLAFTLRTPGAEPGFGRFLAGWAVGPQHGRAHLAPRHQRLQQREPPYLHRAAKLAARQVVLAGVITPDGFAAARVNISSGEVIHCGTTTCRPEPIPTRWSSDSLDLAAAQNRVIRIQPETLGVRPCWTKTRNCVGPRAAAFNGAELRRPASGRWRVEPLRHRRARKRRSLTAAGRWRGDRVSVGRRRAGGRDVAYDTPDLWRAICSTRTALREATPILREIAAPPSGPARRPHRPCNDRGR